MTTLNFNTINYEKDGINKTWYKLSTNILFNNEKLEIILSTKDNLSYQLITTYIISNKLSTLPLNIEKIDYLDKKTKEKKSFFNLYVLIPFCNEELKISLNCKNSIEYQLLIKSLS